MYVCMCVFVYVSMYCVSGRELPSMYVRMIVCMSARAYVFMFVCMYHGMYVGESRQIRTYVCLCVYMYVCVYVRVYVCIYVYMYVGENRHRRVMSHRWTSNVTHVDESCHVYKLWMSYVTHTDSDESYHTNNCTHPRLSAERSYVTVTHTSRSCPAYGRVILWMSHVTHIITHTLDSLLAAAGDEPSHGQTYEWVMWSIWKSHGTHETESCHTYGWVISHTLLHSPSSLFAAAAEESYHAYGWTSHTPVHTWLHATSTFCSPLQRSRVTHTHESFSRIWTSHVTRTDYSCHTYGQVMSYIRLHSHLTFCMKVQRWRCVR